MRGSRLRKNLRLQANMVGASEFQGKPNGHISTNAVNVDRQFGQRYEGYRYEGYRTAAASPLTDSECGGLWRS